MGDICSMCAETNPAFTATAGSLESNAEKSIALSEKKCSLSKASSINVRKSVNLEAVDGSLSFNQLMRVSGTLGVETSDLRNPDSALSNFFNTFMDEGHGYKERLITLSSILISSSSTKEKSAVIFEIYDLNNNKMIKSSEFKRFLEEAFFVSVDCLPKLAGGGSKGVEQGISEYLKQIQPHESRFVDEMLNLVMNKQPELGLSFFQSALVEKAPHLLTSSGIRTWIFSKYNTKTNN